MGLAWLSRTSTVKAWAIEALNKVAKVNTLIMSCLVSQGRERGLEKGFE